MEDHCPSLGIFIPQRQVGHGLLDLPRGNGFHVLPEIIIKFGLIRLVSESRYHARAIIKHEEDRGAFRAEYKIASDLVRGRSEEHTSELQSLMRISYAVFCLKKKKQKQDTHTHTTCTRSH